MKVAQLCLTLCNPMDYTVHGILQARILEWVAFLFSRGSFQPRNQTQVSHIAGGISCLVTFFLKSVQHWHAVVVLIYCHRSLTPVSFKPSLAISTCWLTTCLTIFFNCTHQSKAIYKQLQLTEFRSMFLWLGLRERNWCWLAQLKVIVQTILQHFLKFIYLF